MHEAISFHFFVVAAWGMAVILSWLGSGVLADRFLWRGALDDGNARTPLGLLAGWGMALVVLAGGVLLALHLATKPVLLALTAVGAVVGLRELWQRLDDLRAAWGSGPVPFLVYLPFAAVLLYFYCGGMQEQALQSYRIDDLPAYLPFVNDILESGGLVQPFSLRRIVSYGGHSLLQAQVLAGAADVNLSFLERGICPIVAGLLLLALIHPRSTRDRLLAYPAIAGLLLTGRYLANMVNSFSLETGVVVFLTLFATLESGESSRTAGAQAAGRWVLLGLIAAAATALRTNFAPAVALVLALYFLPDFVAGREERRRMLAGAGIVCAAALAALVPWAYAQWESCRTPLYPLFRGNYREVGLFSVRKPLRELLTYFWTRLLSHLVWPELLGVVLCANRRLARIGLAFYAPALAMTFLLVYLNPLGDPIHTYRYSFPMLFAAQAGLIALALRSHGSLALRGLGIAIFVVLLEVRGPIALLELDRINRAIGVAMAAPPWLGEGIREEYRASQQVVPAGRRVLVMTSYPHLFDYARNSIELIDMPGTCSPGRGMPMMRPVAEFRDYLVREGVDYVICDDFDAAPGFYNRSSTGADKSTEQSRILTSHSLYVMDMLDALSTSGYLVGTYGPLRVLRLD